jgi:hypothetical protein
MSEVLLGICVVALMLLVTYGFYYLPKKLQVNLRIISGLALLAFVWLAADGSRMSTRLVLSAVVLSSLGKSVSDFRRMHNRHMSGPREKSSL